jgi:tRNA pseudouridine38-40 synthase
VVGKPTARYLVRFGYDGTAFHGWARQPGLRSVEEDIRLGALRAGIIQSAALGGLEVASRTDRGVSARGNALGITSSLPPESLLRALNGIAPEIFFTALAPLSESIRVRRPIRRTYRYFQESRSAHRERWEEGAKLFEGEIDVRSFGRAIPSEAPRWRTIEGVRVTSRDDRIVVEIQAPSFVWGMVRKIVAALREVDAGRLSLAQLATAVRGETRLTFPLAEPEALVLWEVEYPLRWSHFWTGPNRHQRGYLDKVRWGVWNRTQLLEIFENSSNWGPSEG